MTDWWLSDECRYRHLEHHLSFGKGEQMLSNAARGLEIKAAENEDERRLFLAGGRTCSAVIKQNT